MATVLKTRAQYTQEVSSGFAGPNNMNGDIMSSGPPAKCTAFTSSSCDVSRISVVTPVDKDQPIERGLALYCLSRDCRPRLPFAVKSVSDRQPVEASAATPKNVRMVPGDICLTWCKMVLKPSLQICVAVLSG